MVLVYQPCLASDSNELTVQGVFERSMVIVTGLPSSFNVTLAVPVRATLVVLGGSTVLAACPLTGYSQLAPVAGVVEVWLPDDEPLAQAPSTSKGTSNDRTGRGEGMGAMLVMPAAPGPRD
ncbi:hypothetical protein GCM10009638_19940 [Luteococcus sanguinis]